MGTGSASGAHFNAINPEQRSPKTAMLPAPEEIFLRPVTVLLGRGFLAIALFRIARIPIERLGRKDFPPQAFSSIKNA